MQVEPVQSSGSVNLISPILRIFGYNRAVARTNSHFGGVEEGTEFAVSDLRSLRRIKTNYLICVCVLGAKETSPTSSIALTQHSGHVASLRWLVSLAFRMKVIGWKVF